MSDVNSAPISYFGKSLDCAVVCAGAFTSNATGPTIIKIKSAIVFTRMKSPCKFGGRFWADFSGKQTPAWFGGEPSESVVIESVVETLPSYLVLTEE